MTLADVSLNATEHVLKGGVGFCAIYNTVEPQWLEHL